MLPSVDGTASASKLPMLERGLPCSVTNELSRLWRPMGTLKFWHRQALCCKLHITGCSSGQSACLKALLRQVEHAWAIFAIPWSTFLARTLTWILLEAILLVMVLEGHV
jgi:hypothetical protein